MRGLRSPKVIVFLKETNDNSVVCGYLQIDIDIYINLLKLYDFIL